MRTLGVLVLALAACNCGTPKAKKPPAGDDDGAEVKGDAGVKARAPQGPVMGGEASLDELGSKLVKALNEKSSKGMYELLLQRGEFNKLFATLAASPAVQKLGPDFVWSNQDAEVREAMAAALQRHGGKGYTFVRLAGAKTTDRGPLVQHSDAILVVKDEAGAEQELTFVGPIFEHRVDKTFRISVYK